LICEPSTSIAAGALHQASGLTCERTRLAEAHNHSAGAHTGCLAAAYPRILGCSSYEGTGRV